MSIGSRQHTEFLLDFNCELNKKSRDDWKLLSSDHRHDARRSSRQYIRDIAKRVNRTKVWAERRTNIRCLYRVSFSHCVEKTKRVLRMGFRIIMKLSVARTLSFFYISNRGEGWVSVPCFKTALAKYSHKQTGCVWHLSPFPFFWH